MSAGLLCGLLGCASGKYDKDLRLYLDSGETLAAGQVASSGWYVVGARLPGRRFERLGIRFPAEPGERLELCREGDAIFASAAGVRVPVEELPASAIYVAWARENHQPRSYREAGWFDVEVDLFGSMLDSLFDDDDDNDHGHARDRREKREKDRGERYSRSRPADNRQRTRDD